MFTFPAATQMRRSKTAMMDFTAIRSIESGTVIAAGMSGLVIALLVLGHLVGWDATWRAFGVTPLQPPFFDMHVINDYAACAWRGVDAYAPQACNGDSFNIPPTWLWLGLLGVDGSDSTWLSAAIASAALITMVLLFQGRPWSHGVVGLAALISPSVMMGVERGNLDLLILALVGSAALLYERKSRTHMRGHFVSLFWRRAETISDVWRVAGGSL